MGFAALFLRVLRSVEEAPRAGEIICRTVAAKQARSRNDPGRVPVCALPGSFGLPEPETPYYASLFMVKPRPLTSEMGVTTTKALGSMARIRSRMANRERLGITVEITMVSSPV